MTIALSLELSPSVKSLLLTSPGLFTDRRESTLSSVHLRVTQLMAEWKGESECWQTIAKVIEHEINEVLLGFLYEDNGNGSPLLRLFRPNSLRGLTPNRTR